MRSPLLGLVFGLINTTTLHLAKGMQRQGIGMLRWRSLPRDERSKGKAVIYVAGVILNNLTAVWLILANRFAAPAYATGMFGVGLVVLLLYSHVLLGEPVAPINYFGAALVVVGTALFGYHSLTMGRADATLLDSVTVTVFTVAFLLGAGAFAVVAIRNGSTTLVAAAFGIFAGGLASLDPVLKALGQNSGGSAGFIPATAWGWIPFGSSFVLGTIAFLSSQYAFLKGADASSMIPVQTSVYVLIPVVVQLLALPGYTADAILLSGIVLILGGIVFTQMGRRLAPPLDKEAS